ncbi:hypothetical protein FACS189441_2870 [Betaproteobacteria bacterium]|nr:hypothetical protein FACS189441_2870 [Betaproteobacteria bacterium]
MKNTKGFARQKEALTQACHEFWKRFQQHAAEFFAVLDQGTPDDVDEKFFRKIAPWLENISNEFFYLAGMYDEHTAELILTAEGNLKNFVLVETLVDAAPALKNWKITALKPPDDDENQVIHLEEGLKFGADNLSFYLEEDPDYPEEINVVVVDADFNEDNQERIRFGCNLFLDNYLGERYFATAIDNLRVVGEAEATYEPLPINKLKGLLLTQQTRFAASHTHIDDIDVDAIDLDHGDHYSLLEGRLNNTKLIVALVNDRLLNLNVGALYPWVAVLTLPYESQGDSGMPDKKTLKLLDEAEEEILAELSPNSGCLYIARETGNDERTLYFANEDFRAISQFFYYAQKKYAEAFELDCELYKDRYWRTFRRFVRK